MTDESKASVLSVAQFRAQLEKEIAWWRNGNHLSDQMGAYVECADRLEKLLARYAETSAWQPIADAPKRKKVLVSWFNALGNRRTTCAIYYDAGEIAMDDDVPDDCVDIGGDNAEGGWFEDCESRDPSYWPLNEPLTHFQLLPLAPPVLEDDAHER